MALKRDSYSKPRGRPAKEFVQPRIDNVSFAFTWDELARILTQRLGVSITRKSLGNWRDPRMFPQFVGKLPIPRPDGRHDVDAWMRFILETGRHRADETLEPGELRAGVALEDQRSTRDWKNYREELHCQEAERRIARGDNLLLVATELEIPVGALLAAINSKLALFPPTASRFMVMKRDVADAELTLRDEMDAVQKDLNLAGYIEPPINEILNEFPFDKESAALFAKVSFAGQDRQSFLELLRLTVLEVLRRIGRRVLAVGGAPEDRDDSAVGANAPDTDVRTDQIQAASVHRNEPEITCRKKSNREKRLPKASASTQRPVRSSTKNEPGKGKSPHARL